MKHLIEKIDQCIQEEYDRIKKGGYCEKKVEQLVRDIRWTEPELEVYIQKRIGEIQENEQAGLDGTWVFDEEIYTEMKQFVLRVLRGGDMATSQEVAILPQIIKLLAFISQQ